MAEDHAAVNDEAARRSREADQEAVGYASLVFVRTAMPEDNATVRRQGGSLWRKPDGSEVWLHPTTVLRERLTEKMRAGITAELERQADEARKLETLATDEPSRDPVFEHADVRAAARSPRPGEAARKLRDATDDQPPVMREPLHDEAPQTDTPSGSIGGWRWTVVRLPDADDEGYVLFDNKDAVAVAHADGERLAYVQAKLPIPAVVAASRRTGHCA